MSSLPKTYKAAVVSKAGGPFELKDVELKHPGKGQVLVKIKACGVCFSDTAIANGHLGDVFPRVPGHELVGDVVELGEDVQNLSLGQRVGGPWHGGHDRTCRSCLRGSTVTCENGKVNGLTHDGGFAEYAILNAESVVRVPTDMDPAEVAPLLCAGVTVFNGIRKMEIQQGNLVAIQGLGGLGHLAVQYAHNMGYEVAVLSSGDDKADFAKKLGATHYINSKAKDAAEELNKLGGAALIVQTAPNPAVVGPLVKGLQAHGKLLSLAPVGGVEIDTVSLVMKGSSVHGWPAGSALDCEETIRFTKTHGIKCMYHTWPLAKVQEAVDDLVAGKPRFRNVLVME